MTQAKLTCHHCDRTSYVWIGMSLLGLITAILSAIAVGLLSITLFRLDVLQNGQHGAIASMGMVVIFTVVMTLSQWIILRQSVTAPVLQASLNVVLGTAIWLLFVSRILEYEDTVLGLPLFAVLSIGLGAALGGVIHKVLNLID
ncbi:hypothetical protein ACKFKF_04840 [Phormidesmis sp. 146-12]